jgi:hypothetical protein
MPADALCRTSLPTPRREHVVTAHPPSVDAVRVFGLRWLFRGERSSVVCSASFSRQSSDYRWRSARLPYGNGLPPVEGAEVEGLGGHGEVIGSSARGVKRATNRRQSGSLGCSSVRVRRARFRDVIGTVVDRSGKWRRLTRRHKRPSRSCDTRSPMTVWILPRMTHDHSVSGEMPSTVAMYSRMPGM